MVRDVSNPDEGPICPTTPVGDGAPFSLGPDAGRRVLILHGLTGTPWEVRPVGERLASAGYRCTGPLLGGHASYEQLRASAWGDWAQSSERWLGELAAKQPIAVIGFSMGALLALRLAAIAPGRVAALVCMGTPLVLKPYQRWGIRALGQLARVPGLDTLTARIAKPSRTDCSIPSVAAQYPGFDAFPRSSLLELLRLQATVRPLLSQVRCPTMLIHGGHDHSAPVGNVQYAAAQLTSAPTTTKVLSRSFHQIAWDVDATECADSISTFIQTHYPPTTTAP